MERSAESFLTFDHPRGSGRRACQDGSEDDARRIEILGAVVRGVFFDHPYHPYLDQGLGHGFCHHLWTHHGSRLVHDALVAYEVDQFPWKSGLGHAAWRRRDPIATVWLLECVQANLVLLEAHANRALVDVGSDHLGPWREILYHRHDLHGLAQGRGR